MEAQNLTLELLGRLDRMWGAFIVFSTGVFGVIVSSEVEIYFFSRWAIFIFSMSFLFVNAISIRATTRLILEKIEEFNPKDDAHFISFFGGVASSRRMKAIVFITHPMIAVMLLLLIYRPDLLCVSCK